jgi:hypothetical protein
MPVKAGVRGGYISSTRSWKDLKPPAAAASPTGAKLPSGQSVFPGTLYSTPSSALVRIVAVEYPTVWFRHVQSGRKASLGWQEFFRTFRQVEPCDGASIRPALRRGCAGAVRATTGIR